MLSLRREDEAFGSVFSVLGRSVCAAVFVASVTVSSVLEAQVPATSQDSRLSASAHRGIGYAALVRRGRTAMAAGHSADAINLFQQALAIFSDDGRLHQDLARALLVSKAYADAAHEYEAARQLGWGEPAPTALSIASCYLEAGTPDLALHWIETAVGARLKERSALAEDPRFALLRSNPRFRAAVGELAQPISDRIAGWNSDLDFLVTEVHRLHPKFERDLPAEFARRLAALRTNLPQLTDQEIVVEVMALFASVGDAHTVLFPFGMKRGVLSRLPLQFYLFTDGLFVTDAPSDYNSIVGARITRIGGRSVETLIAGLPPFISRDNDGFVGFAAPFMLSLPDVLRRLGAEIGSSGLTLEVLRRDGEKAAITLPLPSGPIDPDKLQLKLMPPRGVAPPAPLWLSHPDDNFWLARLSPRTLYVQLNQCSDSSHLTLSQFAAQMTVELQAPDTLNLVVDVRRNNGGDEDSVRVVAAAMVAFQVERPRARVFVLIGRNTLSAAQNFISTLDQWMNVEFVGEVSGSRPDHVGDDTLVLLPYSGLMGSIACALHQTNYRDLRSWIAPSLPVSLSSEDYFAQRDPGLEAIRREIDRPVEAASSQQ